jgi:hypothetical protein
MQHGLLHQIWLKQQGLQIYAETQQQSLWAAQVADDQMPWCWIDAVVCEKSELLLRKIFRALRAEISPVSASEAAQALQEESLWFVFADHESGSQCQSGVISETKVRVVLLPSLQQLSQSPALRRQVWHYILKLL